MIEAEMLLDEAEKQLGPTEDGLHSKLAALRSKHEQQQQQQGQVQEQQQQLELSAEEWEQLQALASPRLLTVWFNSWQYLTQTEVWSGLVVEITQRLEDKLSYKQRRAMQKWFTPRSAPWAYLRLCCTSMQLCTAFVYNWRTHHCALLLRCIFPLLLVLAIVVVCTVVGIWEINAQQQMRVDAQQAAAAAAIATSASAPSASPQPPRPSPLPSNATLWSEQLAHKGGVAAVAVVGAVTALFAGIIAGITNCKQISDGMVEGYSYMQFKDHTDKIGYQHAVIKDLQLLGELLSKRLTSFQLASGKQDHRIVVFIDDLDRCKPSSIIEVLEAVNLVLADSGITVVNGMDKEFVLSGIQHAYKDVKVMQNASMAAEFLQKIVQVELTLPTPPHNDLATYLAAQGIKLAAGGVQLAADPFADIISSSSSASTSEQLRQDQQQSASAVTMRQQQHQQQQAARQPQQQLDPSAAQQGQQHPEIEELPDTGHSSMVSADQAAKNTTAVAAATAPEQVAASTAEDVRKFAAERMTAVAAATMAASKAQEARDSARMQAEAASSAAAMASRHRPGCPESFRADAAADKAVGLKGGVDDFTARAAEAAQKAATAGNVGGARQFAEQAETFARSAAKAAASVATCSREAKAAAAAALQARAKGVKQELHPAESDGLQLLLRHQLLIDATPREIKRLLNRYLLAKFCCIQQALLTRSWFNDEGLLLAWVFLWWRFPKAMCAVTKYKPKGAQQAPSNLAELVQQTLQKQLGSGGATAGSVTSGGFSGSREPAAAESEITATADELPLHKLALRALRNAEAAVKAAKEAKAAAASSISISIGEDAKPTAKEAKQTAEEQLEAAELQVELAKVWVLSCSSNQELAAFFSLPYSVMQKFRPFGM